MTTPSAAAPTPVRPTWDPTRPVLARLLARMEDLNANYVRVQDGGAIFSARTVPVDGVIPGSGTATITVVREPVSLTDLLVEQTDETTRFLGVLGAPASEFQIPWRTRLSPLLPIEAPPEGHWLLMRVRVDWANPITVHVHAPMETS